VGPLGFEVADFEADESKAPSSLAPASRARWMPER
jgi:hypothetical protein